MVALGTAHGVKTVALLTEMSTPLGLTAGNALEVRESLEVLAGGGPSDVVELTLALAREMLAAAGQPDVDPADALRDGRAMDVWRAMITRPGRRPGRAAAGRPREARGHRAGERRAEPPRRLRGRHRGLAARGRTGAAGRSGLGRRRRGAAGQAGRHGHRRGSRWPSCTPTTRPASTGRSRRSSPASRSAANSRPAPLRRSIDVGLTVGRWPRRSPPRTSAGRPKVVLHDHLDGGLRPLTIIELAEQIGYTDLPATDPDKLGQWFRDAAGLGLARALPRDVRAHGRGDADRARPDPGRPRGGRGPRRRRGRVRRDPLGARAAHRGRAVAGRRWSMRSTTGFRQGEALAAAAGHADPGRRAGDRDAPRRPLARDRRAGGALPRPRRGRFRHRRRRGRVPADPAPGRVRVPAPRELPLHHPRRRGVRAALDLGGDPVVRHRPARATACASSTTSPRRRPGPQLGRLAQYVRDKRIPLEMCPSSNVQTGAAASIAEHPIGLLRALQFRVTVNTDNRLMSGTSMSREMALLVDAFGYDWTRSALVHDQRDEERVHPVRQPAGDHQHDHQARLRTSDELTGHSEPTLSRRGAG